jgi:Glycosyl transferase family 2
MKVVMTLLARDEADIVDAQLAFHLNAGVDFVIATDNGSSDGTTEILESYEQAGHLHLIREAGGGFRQGEWVTRMARLAATDFGADWVVNSDADEFWWPQGGSLRELLAEFPERYGIVGAVVRQFLARPDGDAFFAERLTVRLAQVAPINDPLSPFRPKVKIVHRADPEVVVKDGNHALARTSLAQLPGWYPFEMFHFGSRSFAQFERKAITMKRELGPGAYGHYARVFDAYEAGHLRSFYDVLVVDQEDRARGLADGTLVEDVRLRDAFRSLIGESPAPAGTRFLRHLDQRTALPQTTAADDASHAVEVAVHGEAEVVRLQRSVDEVERRVRLLERRLLPQSRDLSSTP